MHQDTKIIPGRRHQHEEWFIHRRITVNYKATWKADSRDEHRKANMILYSRNLIYERKWRSSLENDDWAQSNYIHLIKASLFSACYFGITFLCIHAISLVFDEGSWIKLSIKEGLFYSSSETCEPYVHSGSRRSSPQYHDLGDFLAGSSCRCMPVAAAGADQGILAAPPDAESQNAPWLKRRAGAKAVPVRIRSTSRRVVWIRKSLFSFMWLSTDTFTLWVIPWILPTFPENCYQKDFVLWKLKKRTGCIDWKVFVTKCVRSELKSHQGVCLRRKY